MKDRVESLRVDVEALITEHDFYTFESEAEASKWFNCFPVETLEESLAVDKGLPRQKASLKDLNLKAKIRKGYYKKKDKLELALIEMNIANIDRILERISKIEKEV